MPLQGYGIIVHEVDFHLVRLLTETSGAVYYRKFNSQLWGELRRLVPQRGLQSVASSPCVVPLRVLSPSSPFLCFSSDVEYSMLRQKNLRFFVESLIEYQ